MSVEDRALREPFIPELENHVEAFERAVHALDEVWTSRGIPPALIEELWDATYMIECWTEHCEIPGLNTLTYELVSMVYDLQQGKIDFAPDAVDVLLEAVPVFRQIVQAEKEGSDTPTLAVDNLLAQLRNTSSAAHAAAIESALERDLLAKLGDDEMQRLCTNVAQGDKPYLIQVRFEHMAVGRGLHELSAATKMHGTLITYWHTGNDEATDAMLLDVLMTARASEDTLHAVLAPLGATMAHLPQMTKLLAARPPGKQNDEGPNITEVREPSQRQSRTYDKMPYRFYVRGPSATIDKCLDELRAAAKLHGEIVAWKFLATGDPELIDLEVFMKSRASGATLKAAFAHLGATADRQPDIPSTREASVESTTDEDSDFQIPHRLFFYEIPAWNMPIDEADRVELLGLPECTIIPETNWPDAFFDYVGERHMLTGAEAQRVIGHFRDLAPGDSAYCHMPPWGLAFYAGDTLLFTVTLCYLCSNAYVYAGQGKNLRAFATYSPAAQALAAILEERLPCLKWEG